MRYLFRGLIRETGRTVEGAVEAETAEDALTALNSNGIVTEDLTPAPMPIGPASRRAPYAPRTAGTAGAPPLPPDEDGPSDGGIDAADDAIVGGSRPAASLPQPVHPGAASSDPIDRAFAEASQAVSFDAVAERYRGKSVWVIDRDKIRRQVAVVVDKAIRTATDDASAHEKHQKDRLDETGDRVRESVAAALKELFKDNRNIASQQSAEEAARQQREQQAQRATQVTPPQPAATAAVSSPQLEALAGRLEAFLGKAETVLTQLQVAARRVGTGGGGGAAGFAPRRMSHIPKPRTDEQSDVLMEIFKSNMKLRDTVRNKSADPAPAEAPADDASPAEAPPADAPAVAADAD